MKRNLLYPTPLYFIDLNWSRSEIWIRVKLAGLKKSFLFFLECTPWAYIAHCLLGLRRLLNVMCILYIHAIYTFYYAQYIGSVIIGLKCIQRNRWLQFIQSSLFVVCRVYYTAGSPSRNVKSVKLYTIIIVFTRIYLYIYI